MESTEITIENIGPVISHSIRLKPGVTVLTGQNEAGKSTCIAAVSALMGGEPDISVRDGAKAGLVKGCGAILSVSKRRSRAGVLEAESTDSKIDISVLVDPPYKQPTAALKARIKALLGLTGAKINPEAFRSIASPEIVAECQDEDPVEFARKIKSKLEKMARDAESSRDRCEGEASALTQQIAEIDDTAEADPAKLQEAVVQASRRESQLLAEVDAHRNFRLKTLQARDRAKEIRDGMGADADALQEQAIGIKSNIQSNQRRIDQQKTLIAKAKELVREVQEELKAKEAALAELEKRRTNLDERLAEVIAAEDSNLAARQELETLEQIINQPTAPPPSPDELKAAADAITAARKAVEQGAVIRAAQDAKLKRDAKIKEAECHAGEALQIRNSAGSTDDVLSEAVACETLKVVEGDLVYVEGDRKEPYSRLSDGKRWQIAIREVARAFQSRHRDKPCILTVPQYAWGELDEPNKLIVHQAAVESGVSIVTAETGSGLLSSRWFGEE